MTRPIVPTTNISTNILTPRRAIRHKTTPINQMSPPHVVVSVNAITISKWISIHMAQTFKSRCSRSHGEITCEKALCSIRLRAA